MIAKSIIRHYLEQAGVLIDGPNPWDIHLNDERWYKRIFRETNLGMGESYMDGWWECARIDEMICRLLKSGIEDKMRRKWKDYIRLLPALFLNFQSKFFAKKNVARHYDIGNDLFFSFLDSNNQYSCGFFDQTEDLETAQQKKIELICSKLHLSENDRLLDIGCGWGGLARYAAKRYNCSVTGINPSTEQIAFTGECEKNPNIRFLKKDYREITGKFNKIVSVGMFEHVGWKNYRAFFKKVFECIEDKGIFLLHTIGGNRSKKDCDPWITKYIFPNGMLPSSAQIAKAVEGLFIIEDWHNIGPHYDKTLMAWNNRFQAAWPQLKKTYGIRFKRMWEYYLLACAGAFRARDIQVWQIVMTKFGSGFHPPCLR